MERMEAAWFHIRRRIAPKKLMGCWSFRRTLGGKSSDGDQFVEHRERLLGNKLKDLFVLSPPPPPPSSSSSSSSSHEKAPPPSSCHGRRLVGTDRPRPNRMFGFRYRLMLRRAWRPGLGAIPE